MDKFRHLLTSHAGIEWSMDYDKAEERYTFKASQDATPILDANKAMFNHNDGYSPTREWRRAASIPAIVRLKWLHEEGWDCLNLSDPDVRKKLREKLNSSEYLYLRTAPGRL